MSRVIDFPGVTRTAPARPTCLADLPEGAKALAIVAERNRFAVVMRPALTATERAVRRPFNTPVEARQFARRMSIAFPLLYRLIIDETAPEDVGGAA